MLTLSDWTMYILTCCIAAGTPGPGTLAVISSSILHGSKKTIGLMVGIAFGLGIVAAVTLLGLSQVLAESHNVFVALQYAGIGYIIYIGVQCIRASFTANARQQSAGDSSHWGLLSGVWISVLNPKTFMFFMAFFPTYLAKSYSGTHLNLGVVLAVVLIVCTFSIHIAYSLVGQKLSATLSTKGRQINLVTGVLFIALGGLMAL